MRLSLSLLFCRPFFVRFQTTTKGEERTTPTLSLFSLSLSRGGGGVLRKSAAGLCGSGPMRSPPLSLFVTLNSNTLNQWVLKSARDTFLFVTPFLSTAARRSRPKVTRKRRRRRRRRRECQKLHPRRGIRSSFSSTRDVSRWWCPSFCFFLRRRRNTKRIALIIRGGSVSRARKRNSTSNRAASTWCTRRTFCAAKIGRCAKT